MRKGELIELVLGLCETMMDSEQRRTKRETAAAKKREEERRAQQEAEARRVEAEERRVEAEEKLRACEVERQRKAVEEEPFVLELMKKWGREGSLKRLRHGKYGNAKAGGQGFTYADLLLAYAHPYLPGLRRYIDWLGEMSGDNELADLEGQGTLSDFNGWLEFNIDEDVAKNIWEYDSYRPELSVAVDSIMDTRKWLVEAAGWSDHPFASIETISVRDSTFLRLKKIEEGEVCCSKCGERAVRKKSKTEKNPGRLYWSCPDRDCDERWIRWC